MNAFRSNVAEYYLMQHDFVNHSINREDDASRQQDHNNNTKHLVAFGDDILIETPIDGHIFMPRKWQKSHEESKQPTHDYLEGDTTAVLGIF